MCVGVYEYAHMRPDAHGNQKSMLDPFWIELLEAGDVQFECWKQNIISLQEKLLFFTSKSFHTPVKRSLSHS